MAEAYIVEAVRTAGGKRGGALKDWHPVDLAAQVLNALVERTGIDPAVRITSGISPLLLPAARGGPALPARTREWRVRGRAGLECRRARG